MLPRRSLLAAALSLCRVAASQSQPTPEALLAAKLASPFLARAPWLLDWSAARAQAKATGRLIFGYFTTAAY